MGQRKSKAFPLLSHRNARAQRAFLVAYAKTGSVTRAAKAARIDRRTHQNWMKADGDAGAQYREAFEDAQEIAADALEEEARRRAVKGLVRFRFTKDGSPILHPRTRKPYFEHEYSDTLLVQLLKANRPTKFRERVEHSGEVAGQYELVITSAREALARKLARLAERGGPDRVPGQPD